MAPKLTGRHIALPPFGAMRVNLAAQVLSHSVAAGINTLCSLKEMPDEASTTFDELFKAFNSAKLRSSYKYKSALSVNSGHMPFLKSHLRFLSKLKTGQNVFVPCMIGWQISISSLIAIWEDLQHVEFKYFLTNLLNKDCLENFFSIIRGHVRFRDNPDSQQFRVASRHVIIDKLFVLSTSDNCELDADKILFDISNVTILQKRSNERSEDRLGTGPVTVVMPAPSMPKNNFAAYMAGHLIKISIEQLHNLLSNISGANST